MTPFLSEAWIAELDTALRSSSARLVPSDGIGDDRLVIEQQVPDAPHGVLRYQVSFGPNGGEVCAGGDETPHLVLVMDYETALAIYRGEGNAQQALTAGRLQVHGHLPSVLLRAGALNALGDVFASMRER